MSKTDKHFTLEYSAIEGLLMVDALRRQASREEMEALRLDKDPVMQGLGAEQARNRANALSYVADKMNVDIRSRLADDASAAWERMGL